MNLNVPERESNSKGWGMSSHANGERVNSGLAVLENQFRITTHSTGKRYSLSGSDLLEDDAAFSRLILIFGRHIGLTTQSYVLGSILAKYYGTQVSAGVLFAFCQLDLDIGASLDDTVIETDEEWNPTIRIKNVNVMSSHSNRQFIREHVVKKVFAQHLTPMFKKIVQTTGVKEELLWANVAFSLYWYFETWIKEAEDAEQKKRLQEDFQFVTRQAPPELFGLHDKNPLAMTFDEVEHPSTGEPFRLRKICCLRYKMSGCNNCTTCPGINQEQRRALLEEYEKK